MFASYQYPDGRTSKQLVCVLNVLNVTSAVITPESVEHYGLEVTPGHYTSTQITLDGKSHGKVVHGKWRVMRKG